jgi:hypothetical protein
MIVTEGIYKKEAKPREPTLMSFHKSQREKSSLYADEDGKQIDKKPTKDIKLGEGTCSSWLEKCRPISCTVSKKQKAAHFKIRDASTSQ